MNYDRVMQNLIEALKADKTVNPKWRNKIVSDLERTECMLPRLVSREVGKAEMESLAKTAATQYQTVIPGCMCGHTGPPYDPGCPTHGL